MDFNLWCVHKYTPVYLCTHTRLVKFRIGRTMQCCCRASYTHYSLVDLSPLSSPLYCALVLLRKAQDVPYDVVGYFDLSLRRCR